MSELKVSPLPKWLQTVSSWLFSTDHKKIGVMYMVIGFIFFFVGGFSAEIIRAQLADPANKVVTPEVFNGLVSMHGTIMIFLWVMPVLAGVINFAMPLQIGAPDMAFPRLNSLSLWLAIGGGAILSTSFIFGMPGAGWTSYTPLSIYDPKDIGQDIWLVGIELLGISSILTGVNIIVTIFKLRTKGMKLMRMPLFVWTSLVMGWLMLLAMPAIAIALLAALVEHHAGLKFFNPVGGGSPLLFQHLFWFFGHPEVYILIIPAFGMISEVIPTYARKPLFGYTPMVIATLAIAFFGFIVWAHHMFTSGMDPRLNMPFMLLTTIIGVPTGIKIFNWLGTLFKGAIRFEVPMLWALGFIFTFTFGGLTGIALALIPFVVQAHDTYFIVGHMHYVLFGGAVMGIFAGLYHWLPKITGRMSSKTLGHLHFWLTLIGVTMTFLPMHWIGMMGMPRRVYTYDEAFKPDNLVATIGSAIMGVAQIFFVINVIWTKFKGKIAGNNPWDAKGLEWTISSPPPAHNFDTPPEVTEGPYNYGVHKEGK